VPSVRDWHWIIAGESEVIEPAVLAQDKSSHRLAAAHRDMSLPL
jgi:hypothetical protein